MNEKRCNKCGREKPATEQYFYPYSKTAGKGLRPTCKSCEKRIVRTSQENRKKYDRDRYLTNRRKAQLKKARQRYNTKLLEIGYDPRLMVAFFAAIQKFDFTRAIHASSTKTATRATPTGQRPPDDAKSRQGRPYPGSGCYIPKPDVVRTRKAATA